MKLCNVSFVRGFCYDWFFLNVKSCLKFYIEFLKSGIFEDLNVRKKI